MRIDQCQKISQIDDPQLAGNAEVAVPAVPTAETGKRRRGRPPKNQMRSSAPPPPPPQTKNEDEEDVCFICFDGGSLVLCDRRGCPKAYHPACIKRDEAFFKSAAKWNCGWHICSTCQKASHYMCYTCTYSLCKNCTKDADYLNVRGNKGFCGTCMRIVMMIENCASGNEEMVQVDFDDKTSWEYLFKVYWVLLKEKLSLRLDELTNAKNPLKETAIMGPTGVSSGELNNYSNAKGTNMEKSGGDQGDSYSKRRKTIKQQKVLNNVEYLEAENQGVMRGMPFPGGTNWATTELLEFVAHMKNGDVSVLSHFDVQELLLEYITQNNLRDPRQKSHIICDSMLIKLFRKERVGHFEMLKLLESHFFIQDHSRVIDTVRGGGSEAIAIHLASDGNSDNQPIIANDKRRRTRKKVDEKGQKANPDEYAAVDVHNLNLIYLKRNLIENLIDDVEKVYDKVVGSFVRIKIPGNDQKQDLYRLVQVVGTSKAEPYKIGERTADIMLEILNFDKKEVVAIDGVSNQDFSEDECQRVHQRVTYGLTKWFTVGEIQEKAMALQAVRVNDSEILRVTNLRDRASEKGNMKEYRECIEKLQLLNSPDERQRRLHKVPDIHCDPDMKRYCKSVKVVGELNEKKDNMKPRDYGSSMKEKEPAIPLNGNDVLTDIGSRGTSLQPHATEMELSVKNIETDNIWHYQDPLGKIQGPFAMAMLRRWSVSGHFPPDLRIWRVSEKQDNSILLTDALAGLYAQVKQLSCNSCMPTEDIRVASNDGCLSGDGNGRQNTDLNAAHMTSKELEGMLNSKLSDVSGHCGGNNESMKEKELDLQSSPCTASVDIINSNPVQKGGPLPHCESAKGDNNFHGLHPVISSLPSSTLSGKPCETQSHQFTKDNRVERFASGSINMNDNMNKTSNGQIIAVIVKQDNSEGRSGISSEQRWISPSSDDASKGWDSSSGLSSLARALEASEHNPHIDFSDIPTSTSKLNHEDSKGQATESKQSLSLNVPHQDGPSWSTASSLVGNSQLPEVVGEWGGHSSPANPSAKEWDSDIVPGSFFKSCIMGSDHVATPTSGGGHLTLSSPMDNANNASAWNPIVPEPNEGDESVSDLLAEVEAMESLNGLTSPTSIMRYNVEFAQGSEPDCFSPVGGLSPTPDPGKSDAFSSTNDLQMSSQSTVTTEPFGVSRSEVLGTQKSSSGHSEVLGAQKSSGGHSEVLGAQKSSGGHSEVLGAQKSSGGYSSTSTEINKSTRPSNVLINQYKACSDMQPRAPPAATWGMDTIDTAWRTGPVTPSSNYGAVHGNANFSSKGLGQGTTNFHRGTGQGTSHKNSSINSGASAENPPYCASQPRYSPRHCDPQGRDSSSARGRSLSNRHSSYYGGPNGVGTFRPPPKGLRICKFYESGYCKKGASCRYWHP